MEFHHVSVLRNETINHLIGDPHGIYVDCTLGGGGHSRVLAERLAGDATLIGLDQDEDAIAAATAHMKGTACHFIPVQENFRNLGQVLDKLHIDAVDGVMFDLGVSSYQLDTPERGFSYMQDGPLDMRMDRSARKSAYDVVNTYSEAELYRVVKDYGEERWASRIAELSSGNGSRSPLVIRLNSYPSSRKLFLREPARMDRIRPSGRFRQSGLKSMMNWVFSMMPSKRQRSG